MDQFPGAGWSGAFEAGPSAHGEKVGAGAVQHLHGVLPVLLPGVREFGGQL